MSTFKHTAVLWSWVWSLMGGYAFGQEYENVKQKLYPKSQKIELLLPSVGRFLNQAYVDTSTVGMGIGYYLNESWGIHLSGVFAFNQDRPTRDCLENFFNDFEERIDASCAPGGSPKAQPLMTPSGAPIPGANMGPAYVGIRELQMGGLIEGSWNPVYGKQIALLSVTSYFDMFVKGGLGIAQSLYYPATTYLRDGRRARGPSPPPEPGCPASPGICPSDPLFDELVGKAGRPDPELQYTPLLTLSLGQKFHFKSSFYIVASVSSWSFLRQHASLVPWMHLGIGTGVRL